jgi:glycosyltransferase involved in cell wall biosynthesis
VRILYLTDRLSHRGGAGNHLLDVLHSAAQRAEVTLAAGQIQAPLPPGVGGHRVRGLAASTAQVSGLGGLGRLLDEADVIHVQNVMNPLALQAAIASGRAIVTIQDHRVFCPGPGRTLPEGTGCTEPMGDETCTACLPDLDYRHRLLALTQARAEALSGARLVVLSRYMAQELELAGLPGAVVIPPAVEAAEAPSPVGRGFVLAGRLVQHKGTDLALEAWTQARVDSPLRVAGLGPLAAQISGAQQLGWLDRPALRHLLADARALIFPSRWQEPFGIIGVEALSVGTPVIAMVRGGMSDWADHGTLCIEPGDTARMARAIQTLNRDPALAATLGQAGWASVRQRYQESQVMERLWSIYTDTA